MATPFRKLKAASHRDVFASSKFDEERETKSFRYDKKDYTVMLEDPHYCNDATCSSNNKTRRSSSSSSKTKSATRRSKPSVDNNYLWDNDEEQEETRIFGSGLLGKSYSNLKSHVTMMLIRKEIEMEEWTTHRYKIR